VGDKLRTKTHGIGKGKVRVAWEVFLDEASLLKFQAEQQEVHRQRMQAEGLPGYVDSSENHVIQVTIFPEAMDFVSGLKAGAKVRVAAAGVDRKPTMEPVPATLDAIKKVGRNTVVTLSLSQPAGNNFQPAGLARVWP